MESPGPPQPTVHLTVGRPGQRGATPETMNTPTGVCWCEKLKILVVSDRGNNRVNVFDATTGELKRAFTEFRANGLLSMPEGVAADPQGQLYIADYGHSRILVASLQPGSRHEEVLPVPGLAGPFGLSLSPNGRVLAVCSVMHCVHLVSLGKNKDPVVLGTPSHEGGSGPGELQYPTNCAWHPDGKRIVVADRSNHRVQTFDAKDGSLVHSFGTFGNVDGKLNLPGAVAVDDEYIVVLDVARIQIFDFDGNFVSVLTTVQRTSNDFIPGGLALNTENGLLAVAASEEHAVFAIELC